VENDMFQLNNNNKSAGMAVGLVKKTLLFPPIPQKVTFSSNEDVYLFTWR